VPGIQISFVRLFFSAALLAGIAAAQAPHIGVLDFYGVRKVPETRIRKALGVGEGDFLPPSKGDTEDALDQVPGVLDSHLEAVCCDDGKMILYVGIEEKGSPHFELHDPPDRDLNLPEDVTSTYRRFMDAFESSVRRGDTAEDLTHGHSLMADPRARALQEQFVPLAKDHLKELRDVLRYSSDEDQRAVAAYVIGYAPDKASIVDNLQYALQDSDAGVRGNATRGMIALAVLAKLDPHAGIKIQPTWFIEMLNSLSWADRNNALKALQILTDDHDPAALEQLRDRALPALVEMAQWKTLSHALPAFILLGRVGGLSEIRRRLRGREATGRR